MLIERLMKVALLGSEWVLYLLIALSVLSFSTMVERWVYLYRRRDSSLRARLGERLNVDDLAGAQAVLRESRSLQARVVAQALEWMAGGPSAMSDAMESEILLVRKQLERGVTLLGTLGNNAPFVGLLGTVIGIVRAFRELENSSAQVSAGLMAEVGEALVATAIGLLVALPAVAFFNFYQRVIRTRVSRAGALSHEILAFRKSEQLPTAAE